jgi:hypothetical protein
MMGRTMGMEKWLILLPLQIKPDFPHNPDKGVPKLKNNINLINCLKYGI